MIKKLVAACALIGVVSIPASAHHSFAMFEADREVTLTGKLDSFEWTNPHSFITLTAPSGDGEMRKWRIETSSPLVLRRLGWTRSVIAPGDRISVVLHPRKDGGAEGSLVSLTTPTGQVLYPTGVKR